MRAVQFSKIFWKEKAFKSSDKAGRLHGALAFIFMKGRIAMDDFSKLIQSIGATAEMAAIFYNALLKAGLSENVAITLTAKMIGEVVRSSSNTSQEDKQ